jgi:hypothetical protein
MNWLSGIKAANKKTGNINVDFLVARQTCLTGVNTTEIDLYRKGIEDTLSELGLNKD